jgi:hypothetical protein
MSALVQLVFVHLVNRLGFAIKAAMIPGTTFGVATRSARLLKTSKKVYRRQV